MKSITPVLILYLSFSGVVASADILFMDFNGNGSSIIATQEAAHKLVTPEKVFVFPSGKIPISKITFEKFVSNLEAHNITIDTIVESGHDAGGNFGGKKGSLSKNEIAAIVEHHAFLKQGVRAIVLRGCYTATLGEQLLPSEDLIKSGISEKPADEYSYWRQIFSNLEYIAGYNDPSESSQKDRSKEFVLNAILFKDQFANDKSLQELKRDFSLLSQRDDSDPNNRLSNIAVWTNPQKYCNCSLDPQGYDLEVSRVAPLALSAAENECKKPSVKKPFTASLDVIKKYFEGTEPGYEKIPEIHNSDLREAYSYLRKHDYCIGLLLGSGEDSVAPDRVERLVYFNYMLSNFEDMYPIAPIQSRLDKYFFGKDRVVLIPATRYFRATLAEAAHHLKGVVETLWEQQKQIEILGKTPETKRRADDIAAIDHYVDRLDAGPYRLSRYNVPMDWVSNPHSHKPLE